VPAEAEAEAKDAETGETKDFGGLRLHMAQWLTPLWLVLVLVGCS
jgi:hypothetical protein